MLNYEEPITVLLSGTLAIVHFPYCIHVAFQKSLHKIMPKNVGFLQKPHSRVNDHVELLTLNCYPQMLPGFVCMRRKLNIKLESHYFVSLFFMCLHKVANTNTIAQLHWVILAYTDQCEKIK